MSFRCTNQTLLVSTLFLAGAIALSWGISSRVQADAPAATRVEVDQLTGTIRVIIQGRPVAMFDDQGLHVVNDVNYGGDLADLGRDSLQSKISGSPSDHQRNSE